MRKLILEVQMSVDGFIADVNGGTDWMIWNWGPEWNWDTKLQQYHTKLNKSVDCILLSRQMAEEGFIAHWANAAQNRDDARFEFANHINNTHKIVFTSTLDKTVAIPGGWDNADIAQGNFVESITSLKKKDGRDIIAYGGASFVSSLIKARLIDEFHLIINPVAVGKGMPIFGDIDTNQNLRLIKATGFESGAVVLHYALNADEQCL